MGAGKGKNRRVTTTSNKVRATKTKRGLRNNSNKFVEFVEDNEWEGERWSWFIPIKGNASAINLLKKEIEEDPDYTIRDEQLTKSKVDSLVDSSDEGYLDRYNKLQGTLNIKKVKTLIADINNNSLNKGGIRNLTGKGGKTPVKAKVKKTPKRKFGLGDQVETKWGEGPEQIACISYDPSSDDPSRSYSYDISAHNRQRVRYERFSNDHLKLINSAVPNKQDEHLQDNLAKIVVLRYRQELHTEKKGVMMKQLDGLKARITGVWTGGQNRFELAFYEFYGGDILDEIELDVNPVFNEEDFQLPEDDSTEQ